MKSPAFAIAAFVVLCETCTAADLAPCGGAWPLQERIDEIAAKEPELAECCVPECVYRGFCPEFKSCGYCGSPEWRKAVEKYREVK